MMTTNTERGGLLNQIIEFSLRNRFLVAFAIILAAILGIMVVRAMDTDLFPDLSSPVITVIVENPGLAAQEGETLIARQLESAFRSLPNVIRVKSESEIGVVSVRTEFKFGTDYYLARQLLAERLNTAARDFPAGTQAPVLSSAASRLGEVLQVYVGQKGENVDTKELKETADFFIRYKLQTVPGIIRITSLGGDRRQYEAALDANRMRSYTITLDEVVDALGESNENFSGGFITGTATEMDVRGLGRINSLDDLAHVVVAVREGVPVLLCDIAEVRIQRGPSTIKREDQVRRIQLTLNVAGRDVGSVVSDIEKGLANIKLPPGYFISYGGSYERQQELRGQLIGAFILSALLVFLLLYLAFRSIWQALLVIVTIPLALAGGFIALWITGTTLNVSSIIGLLAHFGLSVQKGLILVEYVNQLRAEGLDLRTALYKGAHTRMRPVLMTAASAGLGVLPIAIGWGAGAELQQPLAIALIGGLITSTILTLVTLPALYEIGEGCNIKFTRA
jgi:Cu/Ag efflux pump CusA